MRAWVRELERSWMHEAYAWAWVLLCGPQNMEYNRANREVAILCNHQRTVPKKQDEALAKMKEKAREG